MVRVDRDAAFAAETQLLRDRLDEVSDRLNAATDPEEVAALKAEMTELSADWVEHGARVVRDREPVMALAASETRSMLPVYFLIFLVLTVAWVVALNAASTNAPSTPLTDEPSQYADLLLDKADLPAIYVGELLDIDGDDTPDVALFGDPEAPTLRPLTEQPTPWWKPALLTGGFVVFAAFVAATGQIGAAWIKQRQKPEEPQAQTE